ncbi:nucleotidyltransferase domain-containing protein [Candidatus Poriferisodalis sp.]|uniref:nucleotidyltransferase domain-containing protein n=1 Tax=Candidatus Poriferisodalis sp. TaxID=3101277 RepID=UPI003B018280
MAGPDLGAARRAADELVSAGVGTVLLFGSLARGDTATPGDIDLVAIYDDLGDYGGRAACRAELQRRARAVSGCPVDVIVTDAPEWATRTTGVPCSIEALIAEDAITLADIDQHGEIDWDKDIGMPATPAAELQERFANLADAVLDLTANLVPGTEEARAAAAGDLSEHTATELRRFAKACSAAHMVFESSAKIMLILTAGAPPPREHRIPTLLATQPQWVSEAFEAAARNIDLIKLSDWHQAQHYAGSWPHDEFDDTYLRRHASAAIGIATFSAEQCQHRELDADLMRRFDVRMGNCQAALTGSLRAAYRNRTAGTVTAAEATRPRTLSEATSPPVLRGAGGRGPVGLG